MTAPEPWHFLYFLPLPQGQGSLRPTLRLAAAPSGRLLAAVAGAAAPMRTDCPAAAARACVRVVVSLAGPLSRSSPLGGSGGAVGAARGTRVTWEKRRAHVRR